MQAATGCDGVMVAVPHRASVDLLASGQSLGLPPPPGREGERNPETPAEEGRILPGAEPVLYELERRSCPATTAAPQAVSCGDTNGSFRSLPVRPGEPLRRSVRRKVIDTFFAESDPAAHHRNSWSARGIVGLGLRRLHAGRPYLRVSSQSDHFLENCHPRP